MPDNMLLHLSKKFNEEIERQELEMGKGMCKDFAAYRNIVGVIQGLRRADIIVLEVNKAIEQEENEDE